MPRAVAARAPPRCTYRAAPGGRRHGGGSSSSSSALLVAAARRARPSGGARRARPRSRSTACSAPSRRSTSTSGRPTSRSSAARPTVEVRRTDEFAFGRRPDATRRRRRSACCASLALPRHRDRHLPAALPDRGARQRAGQRHHDQRPRRGRLAQRLGAHPDRLGRHRRRRLLRLPARRHVGVGRRARRRRLLARPDGAALGERRRARDRPDRPLPGRREQRRGNASACAT